MVNPVGMKDVAARSGVSLGTVSNVLNRPASVSPATRQRVEAAIAELGFVRNESARQLRAGRSRTIAYVLLDAGNPFFTDVAHGVEEAARDAGLAVFLCNSVQDAKRQNDYLDLLLEQRVRGVLVTPVDTDSDRLVLLPRRGVPVVLLDRARHGGFDGCSVSVDDVEGGDLAVAHLLEQGHRRIAFIGGPQSILQVEERLTGARRALSAAGHDPADLHVLDTSEMTVAAGREAGERLAGLPQRRRATAVFCGNDLLAVGYDDIDFAAAAAVPLTSVRQPRHLLGRTATRLLLAEDAAAAQGLEHRHERIQFTPELVVRQSTRPR
jgi:LacI family transcriptional regulator